MPRKIAQRLGETEPVERCGWPSCRAACCVYGTWIDAGKVEDLLGHASLIGPHLPPERRDPTQWFGAENEEDRHAPRGTALHTKVIADPDHYGGTACVFLRPDYKCALQVAGSENGFHPWRFKPFYCILHPLDLDETGQITLDEVRHMVDEPASCLRKAEHEIMLKELFSDELEYLT